MRNPLALRTTLDAVSLTLKFRDDQLAHMASMSFTATEELTALNAEIATLRQQLGVANVRIISVVQEVNKALLDSQLSRASQRYLHLLASHLTVGMSISPSNDGDLKNG